MTVTADPKGRKVAQSARATTLPRPAAAGSRRGALAPKPKAAGEQHSLKSVFDGAAVALPCGDDPSDWWADTSDTASINRAKAGCKRCPIRLGCLEHAIDHEKFGVWGGLDEEERAAERRRRRRAS